MADVAMTRDGVRLGYTLWPGDPNRRIALIHSLALDRSFWDGVAKRLSANGCSILAYDARGHGASDKPAGPYSVELFANDLADLLDAVGWRSAVVAGASMGGCAALAFAAGYPSRVDGLGLIDTTAWYGAEAPKQWEERAQKAATDGFSAMADFQMTRWFGDRFRAEHKDIVQRFFEIFSRNDAATYLSLCRMLGSADLRQRISSIAVPTAIMVGEEDFATPVAMAQALHEGIPGSSLTVIEGARHLTPIEVPDRIAAELERLLTATAV
jgi:3-oxoadipate enol-lactonase